MLTINRYSFGLSRTLIFIILFLCGSLQIQANEMKLVFTNYKPYSWQEDNGDIRGIEIDILKEALQKRMGLELSFEFLPWARAQRYVKEGKADAFVAVPTDKRSTYSRASNEPMYRWVVSIFTPSFGDNVDVLINAKKIADLKGFKIGAMLGNGWAEQHLKGMDVLWVATMEQLMTLMATKRVDALVDSAAVINHYIKAMKLKGKLIEIKGIAASNIYLCIGFSSKHINILPEFDRTIREMRKDGTLTRVIEKYN